MYIIIVGAGEVGSYLARILVEENHNVAVIEQSQALARDLDGALDCLVVQGSGVSREVLEQAGLRKADLIIAVTEVDEVNLVVCMTAEKFGRQIGRDPRTVARVRQIDYLRGGSALNATDLGLDFLVGPEQAVASMVVDLLGYEGAGEIRHMAGNRIELIELPLGPDSPLVHETLAELKGDLPGNSLIVGVRGPKGFRIPRGDDRMQADERAFVLTLPGNIDEFVILSGKPWHHVKDVLIVGCGHIGMHLAIELENQALYPTIIEKDRGRAELVAHKLRKSVVLHGDGTDLAFLREQLEESADAVVVLMGDPEKAVLTGLFAKHLGAKKVIVRCDKQAYGAIAHKMGVDALISPRRAVANSILRFVRRGHVRSSIMLGDHEGEIIEFKIPDKPRGDAVKRPIKELSIPTGTLVGAVIRKGEVFIPDGDTQLQAGDDVLVVSLPGLIGNMENLLA